MFRSIWHLYVLVFCYASAVNAKRPGIVELDLIFPRNETHASASILPVVFAIQNPHAAEPLFMTSFWNVSRPGNASDYVAGFTLHDATSIDYSSSDPFFLFGFIDSLPESEGTWQLNWYFNAQSCVLNSDPDAESPIQAGWAPPWRGSIIFTTKAGAPELDLVAATDDSTCGETPNTIFEVTGITYLPGDVWSKCPVLGDEIVEADPCAVKINSTSASSIMAQMPRYPTPKSESKAAISFATENKVFLSIALTWMLYYLN